MSMDNDSEMQRVHSFDVSVGVGSDTDSEECDRLNEEETASTSEASRYGRPVPAEASLYSKGALIEPRLQHMSIGTCHRLVRSAVSC